MKVAVDQGMPFVVSHPRKEVAHLMRNGGASRAEMHVAAAASTEVKCSLDYARHLVGVGYSAGQRGADTAPLQLGGAPRETAMHCSQPK